MVVVFEATFADAVAANGELEGAVLVAVIPRLRCTNQNETIDKQDFTWECLPHCSDNGIRWLADVESFKVQPLLKTVVSRLRHSAHNYIGQHMNFEINLR